MNRRQFIHKAAAVTPVPIAGVEAAQSKSELFTLGPDDLDLTPESLDRREVQFVTRSFDVSDAKPIERSPEMGYRLFHIQ